jgi:hypothetical protein
MKARPISIWFDVLFLKVGALKGKILLPSIMTFEEVARILVSNLFKG